MNEDLMDKIQRTRRVMQILNIGLEIDLGEQNVRKCELCLALPVIICNVY